MWSNPGGVDFAAFAGYAQLYANLILSCRRELEGWTVGTYHELRQWCDFMEQLHEEMVPSDKAQAQRYLNDPLSFASTGHDATALAVCRAGLSVKHLGAASHYMLRNLVSNARLGTNLVLVKAVVGAYLDMVDGPEDKPEAIQALVKDLTKEIAPHLQAKMAGEILEHFGPSLLAEELSHLSPRSVYDEEVRYFISPQSVRSFAHSRALAPRIVTLAFCEQCVVACRKCPGLLEVLLLAMVPRPLYLTFGSNRNVRDFASPLGIDLLVSCLLKNQAMLNLWVSVDPFVLMQVAARSPPFRLAYMANCVDC